MMLFCSMGLIPSFFHRKFLLFCLSKFYSFFKLQLNSAHFPRSFPSLAQPRHWISPLIYGQCHTAWQMCYFQGLMNEKSLFFLKGWTLCLESCPLTSPGSLTRSPSLFFLLLLLSRFSRVWLCATPETAAHQAPQSLGFPRQEYWSGLPFPSPTHESEKWKWSRSVVSDP